MNAAVDFSHYDAIDERRLRAIGKLLAATSDNDKYYWQVQVKSAEKELADEVKFLGIKQPNLEEILSDEELFAELQA